VQLDLAVRAVLDDDRVLELDEVLLGRRDQLCTNLLRRLHIRVRQGPVVICIG
jgi:hypothetical protein